MTSQAAFRDEFLNERLHQQVAFGIDSARGMKIDAGRARSCCDAGVLPDPGEPSESDGASCSVSDHAGKENQSLRKRSLAKGLGRRHNSYRALQSLV